MDKAQTDSLKLHPFTDAFELSESGVMVPTYSYFHGELRFDGGEPGYAGSQVIESPTHEWGHSLGDIVTALINDGLSIEFLHEFPFTCYQAYPLMERGDDGWWRYPKDNDSFPQMFSIRATKERCQ